MRHHMKIKGFFRSLRKCKACLWSLQDHSAIQKSTCPPSKQQTTGRKKTASQKKNVTRNDKFKDDYIKCMKELTSKGYAKESLATAEFTASVTKSLHEDHGPCFQNFFLHILLQCWKIKSFDRCFPQ